MKPSWPFGTGIYQFSLDPLNSISNYFDDLFIVAATYFNSNADVTNRTDLL